MREHFSKYHFFFCFKLTTFEPGFRGMIPLVMYTITYKSRLTQKKLYKKTDAIFSIYGRNGINPWHFFLILTWAFRGRWGQFWGWKKTFTKKNNLAFQLCFPCYGIFPTRNALKLTFVFFQLQLYGYYIAHCRG